MGEMQESAAWGKMIGPMSAEGRLKKRTGRTLRAERSRLGAQKGEGIHGRN